MKRRSSGESKPEPVPAVAATDFTAAGWLQNPRWRAWLFGSLLVLGAILVYQPVWQAGFVFDDDLHIKQNRMLFAADGLRQIWFSRDSPQYYPLVFTSFRLEAMLWGLNPAGYHWVNMLLHAASAVLLWRVLRRMNLPGAWLAGAIFAVHPVNVESVAWISERKNTLAMVFFLLSILWYVRDEEEVRSPESKVQSLERSVSGGQTGVFYVPRFTFHVSRLLAHPFYVLSLAAFLCALFSKIAVAPLPLVLLGLAWWREQPRPGKQNTSASGPEPPSHDPISRITHHGLVFTRHSTRTLPYFALSLAAGLISLWFEHQRNLSELVRADGFWGRLAGAGWAIWFYLGKAVAPVRLMPIYPLWKIDPANAWSYLPLLLALAGLALLWRYRRGWGRAWLLGAFYFLVMLLPVLGFLDIGFMSYSLVADHWQYFAIIGPIALLSSQLKVESSKFKAAAAVVLAILSFLTWRQSAIYTDWEAFWSGTLAANPACWRAHYILGDLLLTEKGQVDEAITHYEKALELQPGYAPLHINLGNALRQKGQIQPALAHYQKAVELQPGLAEARCNLGDTLLQLGQDDQGIAQFQRALETASHIQNKISDRAALARIHLVLANALLFRKGQVDEAIVHYRSALEIQPDLAEAHNNLGTALARKGSQHEAIAQYEAALSLRPDSPEPHNGLGGVLFSQRKIKEAIWHFGRALEIRPNFAHACDSLAWALATAPESAERNGVKAIALARQAEELTNGQNALVIRTLAAAYAESGQFKEAIETARRAQQLAAARNDPLLAGQIRHQIELYQAGSPYRDTGYTGN
jgi:tetratricopeptide (TPR) repeat protein